ncbi:WD40 repeat-like protein [Rhizodiscina lignyota]|uniref:WD40 repeat-like protein n=1 Tax=Rhizodiscina lignyota TaxID=1504668 RepID=A0A9P4I6C9_9PEZI|nr:WD40 repeat-like protein [Rhizodiscina lignyota]
MAWQPPNAMSNGAAGGGVEHNGPAGTEYTLQGVMRFLQIQWHTHERERNAWDIERAEMKAKIAKQEGECRQAKHLNDQLTRQIRMLEQALKNERAKAKALKEGKESQGEEKKGEKERENKSHNSFLDVNDDALKLSEQERESQRDKSKYYLTKCVEEITFLLTTPANPPAPQSLPSMTNLNNLPNQDQQMSLEDVYLQQPRPKSQPQNQSGMPPLPNHHPPLPGGDITNIANSSLHLQQGEPMQRQGPSQQHHLPSSMMSEQAPHHQYGGFSSGMEEPVETVTHSFDSSGRPVPSREEESLGVHARSEDPDGWTFDDPPALPDQPPPDLPQPRRPDTDAFPNANSIPVRSPPRTAAATHRRKSSGPTAAARRRSEGHETREAMSLASKNADPQTFKVRFALRGHLDVVRSVIFTGGGSPSEPELCTAGDDGMIKRWIIPASYGNFNQQGTGSDLDISSYFTHRGHEGMVLSLAACCPTSTFSTGGRVSGDGWIFSGGQDATVRVWERGRVDPKATLDGHTDAVWTVCVLPATSGAVFGPDSNNFGGPDRVLLASGSADGTVKVWAVSAPPQITSPQTGSRRGVGGSRRHSVTSGSNYPSSPQPSVATSTPFHYTLVHSIPRQGGASPTCISPLSPNGETFVVSYTDSSILIFDTRTGEEIIGMASSETYDGTPATGINSVVATSVGIEGSSIDSNRGMGEEENPGALHGATGTGGIEGIVISGHEDQFIRFFDANSGQCTYSMLAHPAAISSLSLSKDGREAVSAGHDASIRFWSLDKRICTQEITSHRIMRGEGVCGVVWSQDGRLVVSAGGDSVVKVFAR